MKGTIGKPAVSRFGLTHPVAIAAVVLLLLNDHWFKHSWPSGATGKLSDVAGLIFFPLLLQAIWELPRGLFRKPPVQSNIVLVACLLVTGMVFAGVNVWPPATHLYEVTLGWLQWAPSALIAADSGARPVTFHSVAMTPDVTDLMTLPALLIALRLGWRTHPKKAPIDQVAYCR